MMRSARVGLLLWCLAALCWAFHAASVRVLFGTDQIALLLSPGSHSPVLGLSVAALFLVSRVVALVVSPALAVVGAVQILLSRVRRD